nr:Rab3 GTPase-activating protein catalytic subunit [Tanacetum cinerariifolium]
MVVTVVMVVTVEIDGIGGYGGGGGVAANGIVYHDSKGMDMGQYLASMNFCHSQHPYVGQFMTGNSPTSFCRQILHDMQLSFGLKEFMVIAPQSANGVILDSPEASKLLSTVAIAFYASVTPSARINWKSQTW